MPSTNKLFSLGQSQRSSRHVVSNIAKFLLSFCGIASFGVVTMAIPTSATSATGSTSNNVSVGISSSVAIRLLDSTATFDITRLDFDLTPTASGVTTTKRTVVDVATSNPTGYKLYMQSNYQDHSGNYTTNLVHSYTDVSDYIPSAVPGSGGVSSSATLYWNYINPLLSTTSIIPPHGTPDKIAQLPTQTNSDQTPVDINVSVDTSIVSGTYTNQLLFSAVANPSPVSYSISFDGNGGSPVPSTITGSATSSTFSIPLDSTTPTKLGYTFSHWEITSVSSTSLTPDINPTATCNSTSTCNPGDSLDISSYGEPGVVVALTAVYTVNTHTVTTTNGTGIASTTITCNNNSSNTTNTCTYGDTVTISATPATGYSFDSNTGWSVVSGGVTVENGQFTMPDSDVAITADAVKMYTYTLNLNNNDGTTNKQVLNYPTSGGTADTSHTFTNLNSLAPSRSGYKFLGWATSTSGTSYVSSYTLNSSSASTTPTSSGFPVTGNLYAIWEQDYDGLMQDKAMISQCNKSAVGTTLNLLDTRDNKVYQVRKLADGKCWMTQNLNYLPTEGTTLTSDKSNVDSPVTLSSITTDCSDANIDNFCIVSAGRDDLDYGTYYNWYAATASSGTSSMVAPDVAPYSICPKGWRLPTGGSSGEYQTLYNNYNSWTAMQDSTGPHFALSGYRNGTSTYYHGPNGYYWSSLAHTNATFAYYLGLYGTNSTVLPADYRLKRFGFSVRCVAEKDLTDITTMQEMTSNICTNSARGASNTLTDTRDGKSYTVKKLDDDKCWMTQNLALTAPSGGKLTSTDSNVTSDVTWGTNSSTCSSITEWCVATDSNHPEYGAYYNYYVATAKTSPSSGNASQSICPRGWKLPSTNGTSTDFQVLYNNYNSSAKLRAADGPNLALAGYRSYGSFRRQGSLGYYWPSTAFNSNYAYSLGLDTSDVYPAEFNSKELGFSVRCVAQ